MSLYATSPLKGGAHWGGDVSDAEEAVVEVEAETLADYVGTYLGQWLGRPVTIEIVLQDDKLYMERTGAENELRNGTDRLELFARSANAFDCTCGWAYTFSRNDNGNVDRLIEIHVSGNWLFERVD